jgi:flagellar FliJ protein
MKKFAFSMDKILGLREFREKEARLDLGRAMGEVARLQNNLEATAANRTAALRELSSLANNRGAFREADLILSLATVQNYLVRLGLTQERLLEEKAAADLAADEKRTAFTEAMKNRIVLSNLKDRRHAEYRRELRRAEDAALDEIGATGIPRPL